jgi:signal transduction histidine kinase
VQDNGVGFDVTSIKKGIGIANMRRRVELFSGKFSIQSSVGAGCRILIEVPIKDIN